MSRPSTSTSLRDPFLWGMSIFIGTLLAGLSLARYNGYNAGMLDLGNMAQAIWSAARGQPLLYTAAPAGAISRLSVHVELIYFLIAPLYAAWPDPRLLLLLQAALFALGALPVYRLALRHTGSRYAARCLSLIYLLYPTAQTSVLFDFHGDTLAMPLLLFALDALDRRAWLRYGLFIALALSCKVYVAAAIASLGLYLLLWGGERRAGVLTMAAGLIYGIFAFFIVRAVFMTPTSIATPGQGAAGYISYYFGQLHQIAETWHHRLLSMIVVFGPALFVARHGWRWLLPGLPIAAAALLSTGPAGTYDYRYHHYAIVVPFIMMAAIDGTRRMVEDTRSKVESATCNPQPATPRRRRSWRGDLGLTLAIVAIFNITLVDTPLNPLFWAGIPGQGRDPAVYGITARDQLKDGFLAEHVPPGAPMAASVFLAPHIANRDTLYLTRYPHEPAAEVLRDALPRVDYVLADALFDYYMPLGDNAYGGGLDYDRTAIALVLGDPAFGLVVARDGLLLFQRQPPPGAALEQRVEALPGASVSPLAEHRFGDAIELVEHAVEPLGDGRLRASFTWRALRSLAGRSLVAVSRLEGTAGARIVHLPTYALLPPAEWQPGQLVRETFEIALPPEVAPGSYEWRVGWYVATSPFAAATDERSLLKGTEELALGAVELR